MKLLSTLLLATAVSAIPQATQNVNTCAENILVIARGSTEGGNVVSTEKTVYFLFESLVIANPYSFFSRAP